MISAGKLENFIRLVTIRRTAEGFAPRNWSALKHLTGQRQEIYWDVPGS